jgi:hypothetical protein
VTATDRSRVRHPSQARWGVVCGDGQVVWARDEAAARRLLTSLVGAIRIVCEQGPDAPAPASYPAAPPMQRTAHPHPR